jgi:hypothetical protein
VNSEKREQKDRDKKNAPFFAGIFDESGKSASPAFLEVDSLGGLVLASGGVEWAPGLRDYINFVDNISPYDINRQMETEFFPSIDLSEIISTNLDIECLDEAQLDDHRLYWTNSSGQFDSPKENHPSVFYLDRDLVCYHKSGLLHRTDGPAVKGSGREDAYWLFGVQVSKEEHSRFNPNENSISFLDKKGYLHRDDGPALIKFYPDGKIIKKWFKHGVCTAVDSSSRLRESFQSKTKETESEMSRTIKPKKITTPKVKVLKMNDVPKIPITALQEDEIRSIRELYAANASAFAPYKQAIKETAEAIGRLRLGNEEYERMVRELHGSKDRQKKEERKAPMTMDNKIIRSAPDTSGTRTEQFVEGFKFGFKKGTINNGTELFAKKIVSYTSHEGNEWIERFVQFTTLIGMAELIRRMPDGVAEKMRFDEQARLDAVSMLRYIGGENVGGDIVDIIAAVLPTLLDIVKDISTEELNELAEQMEKNQQQEQEMSVESKRLLEL